MDLCPLTALSPLDGRYAKKLDALRPLLSEYGLAWFRVQVEIAWLIKLANSKKIPELTKLNQEQQSFLQNISDSFSLDDAERIKAIEQTTNHDVKAVEYFLQEKLSARSDFSAFIPFIHFACTSEDINNLAYALMLKQVRQKVLAPKISTIVADLKEKTKRYQNLAMLSRTHGQTATPTTLGKEFAVFTARLERQLNQLIQQPLLGKFNGAVGNYNAHQAAYPEIDWPSVAKEFVESLELQFNPLTTQIEPHDFMAEFLQNLTRVNTILIDLARDIWSYVSLGYFQQQLAKDEVGSSTMPHKVNPIDFENAEGNLGLANALNEHLAMKLPISRWQRDLSDSTVLRNLGCALGYGVLAYESLLKGLKKIHANEQFIRQDLEQRPEVLAEAIQTVMRRYGISDAYEQLKTLTRGKEITLPLLQQFITTLQLPEAAKQNLLKLCPNTYTGFAEKLCRLFVEGIL